MLHGSNIGVRLDRSGISVDFSHLEPDSLGRWIAWWNLVHRLFMPWLFFDRKKESPDIPSAVRWSCGTSSPSFCNRDGIFSEFWDQHGDTILGIPKGCWWRLEIPHWIKNMYRTCIDWSTMLPKSGMFHYHDSFIHVDIDMGENLLVNCPGSGTNRCVCV